MFKEEILFWTELTFIKHTVTTLRGPNQQIYYIFEICSVLPLLPYVLHFGGVRTHTHTQNVYQLIQLIHTFIEQKVYTYFKEQKSDYRFYDQDTVV